MSELHVRTFGPFKMPKNFALELRIGNWVSHYYVLGIPGQPIEYPEIKKIRIDVELLKHIYNNGMLACYHGIPLTPEILEKAGFKKEGLVYQIWFGDSDVLELLPSSDGKWYRFWECDGSEGTEGPGYKYIHQIQNLYFSLSLTELTIEL